MSFAVNDLLADTDLIAYERGILEQFGQTQWQDRRTKALEDWLFPILRSRGFDPYRLRTRYEPDTVFGYTASAYADKTGASKDATEDDINLAAVFATVSTDALYIGSVQPFRGVFLRIIDAVSTVAGTLTASYWSGAWEPVTIADATTINSKTLAGGGSVTWSLPVDWQPRTLNGSAALYWVKLTVSATPTGAKATQVSVIRASCLRAPTTFRTLQLIFQEAPVSAEGPWREKAEFYKDEAEQALQRALLIVGGEFDSDASDQVSEAESEQTVEEVGGGPFTMERA